MAFPLAHHWSKFVHKRHPLNPLQAMVAILLICPPLLTAQPAADRPSVLPELGEDSPDALPDLNLPFLALPYDFPNPSAGDSIARPFELPAVDRYLPPRAIPVPMLRFKNFTIEGNTVFSDEEIVGSLGGFLGREILREDLDQLKFAITRHYVSAGYLNSGATIPEQDFRDGILQIQITEGRLTDVIVTGNKSLTDSYLSSRILLGNKRPLHFPTLQKRLQILQENDNITRLNAELKPGLVPGEALIVIEVGEAPKWSYGLDYHNQRSPSVGGEQADLWFENTNTSGVSDLLRARLGLFSGNPDDLDFAGFDNLSAQYQRPLLADDTTLMLGWLTEDYSILEEPFRSLNIEGESYSIFGGLRRPLHRSLRDEVWLSLLLERSHDQTEVLGRPFSVSPGSVNGELDLTVIRLGLDWTRRSLQSAFSHRSILSVGINALDATEPPTEPDGSFVTWFSESQYSRLLDESGSLLVIHASLGLSNDALPPPAQFRLGGRYTVRGYRENFLVRDNGVGGGVDFRIPILPAEEDHGWEFWLVPFLDGGIAWNDGDSAGEGLLAVGCGIMVNYSDWFSGELFWGIPLVNQDDSSDDLQDQGIHFRLSVARF